MARSEPVRALRNYFSEKEWESLSGDAAFRSALKSLKSIDDVERLSVLGDSLIRLGEHEKRADYSPPGKTNNSGLLGYRNLRSH